MKKIIGTIFNSALILFLSVLANAQAPYNGKPFNGSPQIIPGRVQCEWYDLGGEGIAFHDSDSLNNGSGKLNKPDGSYLNEFRMSEGVDISYTKANDVDNNPFNFVRPKMGELYVGWTEPGEWINYTVKVEETAEYYIGLMYTSNGNGAIMLSVNGQPVTNAIHITSTHVEADTVAWRQWHHWNKIDAIAKIKLNAGIQILTLHTIENGNMNYDFLEFKKALQ